MVGLLKLAINSFLKSFIDFWKLIRYKNILIISSTQCFSYYFLSPNIVLENLFSTRFILLLCSTFLSAAAGYIINDYMDVKLDMVNKPQSVIIGKTISRRWAILLHSGFNVLAVVLAYEISYRVAILVFICSLLLWMYSQYFKKSYLLGNFLVAIMTASTIFILIPFDDRANILGCIAYSTFAFFSNLIREIIKDTEDIKGDSRFNANTLPIKLGIKHTKQILLYLQLCFILLCLCFVILFPTISKVDTIASFQFIIYTTLLIIIPSIYLLFKLWNADTKQHFTHLSFTAKIIMLLGIFSMVFWKTY